MRKLANEDKPQVVTPWMVATSLVMVATSLVMVVTSLVMVATSIIVITTIMTIMSLPRSAAAHLAAGSGYFLTGRVAFDHQIVIIIIEASPEEFSKIANSFPIFKRG